MARGQTQTAVAGTLKITMNAHAIYHQVASQIISDHPQPDLRELTLLVPSYHVVKPLAQALQQQSPHPTLLLPRVVTLHDWCMEIPLDDEVQPDIQRITSLYQALRERNWFTDAELWSLSRELLGLIDELTLNRITLPENQADFIAQLEQAYQANSNSSLQFEAQVVHELWFAMSHGQQLAGIQAQQQRLARLAQQITTPLYVLQSSDFSVVEQHFYQLCQQHTEVSFIDLRQLARTQADCSLFSQILSEQTATPTNLRQLAGNVADTAKLAGIDDADSRRQFSLFPAHGLEQEAEAGALQIRRWLLQGKQSIAVVVLDRLVARRMRALLERAQIQVQDETGWTFATLSVSTVLIRWLEALQNNFYYQEVLDLLKSPFLFADWPVAQRKHAAFLFEQLVRRYGAVVQLESFIRLAKQQQPELLPALQRLQQAAALLTKQRSTLAHWLEKLHASLEALGIIDHWRADMAGQQLLQLLKQWYQELQHDDTRCSFSEWRRWLVQQLDLNTFRDHTITSPVIFTHLAATRWRSFDALLLIGCDDSHLPMPPQSGQWFNDAVRASLELPLSTAQQSQTRDELLGLLTLNRCVLASWQQHKNGDPNLLSPWLQLIRTASPGL